MCGPPATISAWHAEPRERNSLRAGGGAGGGDGGWLGRGAFCGLSTSGGAVVAPYHIVRENTAVPPRSAKRTTSPRPTTAGQRGELHGDEGGRSETTSPCIACCRSASGAAESATSSRSALVVSDRSCALLSESYSAAPESPTAAGRR